RAAEDGRLLLGRTGQIDPDHRILALQDLRKPLGRDVLPQPSGRIVGDDDDHAAPPARRMIARGPGGPAPRGSVPSRLARAGIVLAAAGLAACAGPPANPPDLILAGGRVYTVESDRPWA